MAAPTPNKSNEVVCTPKVKGTLAFAMRNHIHTNRDFAVSSEVDKKWGHKLLKLKDSLHPTHEVILSECSGGSVPKKDEHAYGDAVFGTIELANERGKCLWHARDGDHWPIGVADCPSKSYQKDDMWFKLAWDEDADEDDEASVSIVDPKEKKIYASWGDDEKTHMITMSELNHVPRAPKPFVRVLKYKKI
ncbi:hypothetical protein MOBT1_002543 [Malassezia obtusa]|uniref:Uncharacterized protein n=1 Tax=Malassezia obtusa TaxID=76774 RepID=A0AAF0E053_9BASI|nr:hypothetical protein MOBT1_002543 [Malassezia obtusa]